MERESISSLFCQGLPKGALGRVHSLFSHSMNISIGEELVHIGKVGESLSAFGMNILPEKLYQLLAECQVGDLVKNQGDRLYLYARKEGLAIPLTGMETVNLSIPKLRYERSPDHTVLYHQLQHLDFRALIGLPWNRELEQWFSFLKAKAPMETAEEVRRAIRFFVGRGKGLTPCGDDVLIGYLAVRKTYQTPVLWEQLVWSEVYGQTTDVSAAYYKALLNGYLSADLIALIGGLEQQDVPKVQQLICRMQRLGHTSGNDTLLGFFLGLQAISCIMCNTRNT